MPNNSDTKNEPTLSLDLEELGLNDSSDTEGSDDELNLDATTELQVSTQYGEESEEAPDSLTGEFQNNEKTLVLSADLLGELNAAEDSPVNEEFKETAESAFEENQSPQGDAQLFIETGDKKGEVISIPGTGSLKIGRTSGDYQIDHRSVSALHCIFKNNHGVISVKDMGSTNGSFLNGQKLVAKRMVLLEDGDILSVGQVKLRVKIHNEDEVAPSLPSIPTPPSSPEAAKEPSISDGFDLDLDSLEKSTPDILETGFEIEEPEESVDDNEDHQATTILSNPLSQEDPKENELSNLPTPPAQPDLEPIELGGEEDTGSDKDEMGFPIEEGPSMELSNFESSDDDPFGLDDEEDDGAMPPMALIEEDDNDSDDSADTVKLDTEPVEEVPSMPNFPSIEDIKSTTSASSPLDMEPVADMPASNDDVPKQEEKTKQIKVKKPNSDQTKTNVKLKIKEKGKAAPVEVTSALTRIIAFIGDLLIGATLVLGLGINSEFELILKDLESIYSPFLGLVPIAIPKNIINIYLVTIVYKMITNLFLGVSLFQFLCGMRGTENFLVARVGGVVRDLLGGILAVALVFDLPALFGKPTIKEVITRAMLNRGHPIQAGIMGILFIPALLATNIHFEFIKDYDYKDGFSIKNTKYRDALKTDDGNFNFQLPSLGFGNIKINTKIVGLASYNIEVVEKKSFLRPKISFYDPRYDNYLELVGDKTGSLLRLLNNVKGKDQNFSQKWPLVSQAIDFNSKEENFGKPLPKQLRQGVIDFITSSLTLKIDDLIEQATQFNFDINEKVYFKRIFIEDYQLPPGSLFEIVNFGKSKFIKFKSFSSKAGFGSNSGKKKFEYFLSLDYLGNPAIQFSYAQKPKDDIFLTNFLRSSLKSADIVDSETEFDLNERVEKNPGVFFTVFHKLKDPDKIRDFLFWYDNDIAAYIREHKRDIEEKSLAMEFFLGQLRGLEQMYNVLGKKRSEEIKSIYELSRVGTMREALKRKDYDNLLTDPDSESPQGEQ